MLTAIAATIALITSLAGCKKDLKNLPSNSLPKTNAAANPKMVLFPGAGWVRADQVHLIEPGNYVVRRGVHFLKLERGTNRLVQDFGDFRKPRPSAPGSNGNRSTGNLTASLNATQPNSLAGQAAAASAWITYAEWVNPANQGSINYFTTTWRVPSNPVADGQQLYIFNGLLDQSLGDVLQPVLQWGTKSFSGGNYWSVINAYYGAETQTTLPFYGYTPPVPVNPGDLIQGTMNLVAVDGGSYIYTVASAKIVNGSPVSLGSLTIQEGVTKWGQNESPKGYDSIAPMIPQLNIASETLEAYGQHGYPTVLTDYPSDNYVAMTGIQITTSTTNSPVVSWTGTTPVSNFGQKTVLVGNDVDLYFHSSLPPSISYTTPDVWPDGVPVNLSPTNTGGPIISYSISPALPPGLSFNTSTGVISQTPTTVTPATPYTVTATNSNGTSHFTITISTVADVLFVVTNNSGNSVSITFQRIDGTIQNISGTAAAHSGTHSPFATVPPGLYNITVSPSGQPVNCSMVFNTGQSALNVPGHVFNNINVGTTATNTLNINVP